MSVTMDVLARALGPRNGRGVANPFVSRQHQTALGSAATVRRATLAWARRWRTAPQAIQPGLANPAPLFDLDAVLRRPVRRASGAVRHLLFVGDLSPNAGAADLQAVLARWADRHPDRAIDITWIGNGDLHVVLDAQPLPRNMQQRIIQPSTPSALAEAFYQCGLIIVPPGPASQAHLLWEAAATGLLILGTTRNSHSRAVVLHGVTGWLFDPFVPDALYHALTDVLATDDDRLNDMRSAARAHALQHLFEPIMGER